MIHTNYLRDVSILLYAPHDKLWSLEVYNGLLIVAHDGDESFWYVLRNSTHKAVQKKETTLKRGE